MSITTQCNRSRLWAALCAMAPFAAAAQAGAAAVADAPAPAYHSAFRDYQPAPARVAPDQHWLAANRAVRPSSMAMSHAMLPMPSMPGMAPMPAKADAAADPHAGHDLPHQQGKE